MARSLPPLNTIRVFVAAARLGSFTRAADELAVTHSAVSKQIATLEDYIGAQLFEREAGGVTLTDEGRLLRDSVGPSMGQLRAVFERFNRSPRGSKVLRITTCASLAAHLLMPKLAELQALLPDIELEISTSDRPLDLTKESVDVAIRHGLGHAPNLSSRPLVPGRLLPVVRADKQDEIAALRRIQIFGSNEWVDVDNVEVREHTPVLHLEHLVVAIEAVLSGVGFALLPDVLVRRFLDERRMVQLPIKPVSWPMTFNLIHDPASHRVDIIDRFANALTSIIET